MSFWILYFIAFLPLLVGAIFMCVNKKEFTWQEWIGNSLFCFLIAGLCHLSAIKNSTQDVETWSGQVSAVKHVPEWIEFYQIEHTVEHSSGSGDNRITWTTTYRTNHTDKHPEQWWAYTSIPDLVIEVDNPKYLATKKQLGGTIVPSKGDRSTGRLSSRMQSGDANDYDTPNTTKVIIPITNTYAFENRVRAASTIFSFAKVPDNIQLPEYPANDNHFISDRLVGSASVIDIVKFDQMNSRIGPTKKVNVILVGLNGKSSAYGKWLEAKWFGGKKNDIVIVWGGSNKSPDWVHAFGWTDNKTVLRSLETIVNEYGGVESTLPKIEAEIIQNYKIKDWHDFDYISIPISKGWVMGFAIFTLVSQCFLMWWYNHNDIKLFDSILRRKRVYYR